MTALKKYQKLESPGLWREVPEAQRREVIVNFGEASLMLSDPRTETALTHWSLPAVERLNPGQMPALYAPGADAEETVEIDDPDMIAALETVRGALAGAGPRSGRLRGAILAGSVAVVLALGLFWLPDALVTHTASVVPPATRTVIGDLALADVTRLSGTPCASPLGQRALEKLATRVFGSDAPRLVILPEGMTPALTLPGRIIALNRTLVESRDGPEALAGFALAEAARTTVADPLIPVLDHAGVTATLRLLTTGSLPAASIDGYGEEALQRAPVALDEVALLDRFQAARVPSSPYAYALDPSGETTLGLIEADPWRNGPPTPLLSDGDWISLQAICAD